MSEDRAQNRSHWENEELKLTSAYTTPRGRGGRRQWIVWRNREKDRCGI